jgi:hypothetical protein
VDFGMDDGAVSEFLQILTILRGQMRQIVVDLPLAALNWHPLSEAGDHATNSIGVLATHTIGAEHFWIGEVIGGLPRTRERAGEFTAVIAAKPPLLNRIDVVAAQTATILQEFSAEDLTAVRHARGKNVTVGWAILHTVEHTALHLGHVQITAQLWHARFD